MLDVYARIETVPKSEPIESQFSITGNQVTAQDIITQFVASNSERNGAPLVRPTEAEIALNLSSGEQSQVIRHIGRALSAFTNNGFVLLVDDQQIEALDDEVVLTHDSVVTFLRLTPMVGG